MLAIGAGYVITTNNGGVGEKGGSRGVAEDAASHDLWASPAETTGSLGQTVDCSDQTGATGNPVVLQTRIDQSQNANADQGHCTAFSKAVCKSGVPFRILAC